MKRLFGTDGIRGVAGREPLDPATVRRVGAALAATLARGGGNPPRIAFGRDTRESGPWLRDAVAAGLSDRGAGATDAGVITTPGLAHVTRAGRFDGGVMISASHNPFEDNGLKMFGADGSKLPDEREREIERLVLDEGIADPGEREVALEDGSALRREYVEHLEQVVSGERAFAGLRLLLDCANGSAAAIAPRAFRDLGAEIETLGTDPDGRNINLDCGSLHLDTLAARVRDEGFDLGIAFDGDADRALAVDRRGRTVDGDHILFLCGRRLQRESRLRGDVIVATIMSNLWLERRLADEGIRLLRAPVGDKYVLERMIEAGAVLGGEQSGHVIFRDLATTGDGILTGLLLVETLRRESATLEQILDGIEPCPQVLLNVRVREKPPLETHPAVGPVVTEVERALGDRGRVVLRYSGTEPLARVMVEGFDETEVRAQAERLAAEIRQHLGG